MLLAPEFNRFQASCEAAAPLVDRPTGPADAACTCVEEIQNLHDEIAFLREKDRAKELRLGALEAAVFGPGGGPAPPPTAPPPPPPPAEVVCTAGTSIPYSDRTDANPCSGTVGTVCEFICDANFVKRAGDHVCGTDGTFAGGVCELVTCASYSALPPVEVSSCQMSTGQSTPAGGTKDFGDMCTTACQAGFAAISTASEAHFLCGGSGIWEQQGEALACDDVDECATANGGCDAYSACVNSDGSFTCGDCNAGYVANGPGSCAPLACAPAIIAHSDRGDGE